jgi:Fic family protein
MREAIASSQIEGTQAELEQLLLFQAADQPPDASNDVKEVSNYTRALWHGVSQPAERRVSTALIKEMHQLLLDGVRGQNQRPGELRTGQVWIAGSHGRGLADASFVPPPATSIPPLLEDLERFMNDDTSRMPPLVRLAIAHYQFEAIHPFGDGNGRIGRLLIPLLLARWSLMPQPALYISDFFNVHKDTYINALSMVSRKGGWREWIDLFLLAVSCQALDTSGRIERMSRLREEYRTQYQRGRLSAGMLGVIDRLFSFPAISIPEVERELGVTYPTASKWISTLVSDGLLREVTGNQRNRIFMAPEIFAILKEPPFFAEYTGEGEGATKER